MPGFHMVFHFRAARGRELEVFVGNGSVGLQVLQFNGVGVAVEVHDHDAADERRGGIKPYLGLGQLGGGFLGVEQKMDKIAVVSRLGGFHVKIAGKRALSGDDLDEGTGIFGQRAGIAVGQFFVGQVIPYFLVRHHEEFGVAVSPRDPQLLAAANRVIHRLWESGELERLQQKHMKQSLNGGERADVP